RPEPGAGQEQPPDLARVETVSAPRPGKPAEHARALPDRAAPPQGADAVPGPVWPARFLGRRPGRRPGPRRDLPDPPDGHPPGRAPVQDRDRAAPRQPRAAGPHPALPHRRPAERRSRARADRVRLDLETGDRRLRGQGGGPMSEALLPYYNRELSYVR